VTPPPMTNKHLSSLCLKERKKEKLRLTTHLEVPQPSFSSEKLFQALSVIRREEMMFPQTQELVNCERQSDGTENSAFQEPHTEEKYPWLHVWIVIALVVSLLFGLIIWERSNMTPDKELCQVSSNNGLLWTLANSTEEITTLGEQNQERERVRSMGGKPLTGVGFVPRG